MSTGTVLRPEIEQFLADSRGEIPPLSITAEEFDIIAFRLWRRVSDLGAITDDCGCCKGEALLCNTACR